MTLKIQRVPRSLAAIISSFGGQTPQDFSNEVVGVMDLMQLYGKTQWQLRQTNDPVMPEGNILSLAVPANETWVLFSMAALIAKTATQTALRASLMVGPDASGVTAVWSEELGPYGATVAGAGRIAYTMPYPFILPPFARAAVSLDVLGTDATANVLMTASVGIIGG